MLIPKISIEEAAQILKWDAQYIRGMMQLDRLPIGIAIQIKSKWTYYISPKLLEKYTGKDVRRLIEEMRSGSQNVSESDTSYRREQRDGREEDFDGGGCKNVRDITPVCASGNAIR